MLGLVLVLLGTGCSWWPWRQKEEKPGPAHSFSPADGPSQRPSRGPKPDYGPR